MASKETKARIVTTALDLFNKFGSSNISTNKIASECGISKGNLNYHYIRKSEIILDIFSQMRDEIALDWGNDHLHPTIDHMEFMFLRQINLIWRYRFFYRELVNLLNEDPLLRKRFNDLRMKRRESLKKFMCSLSDLGLISLPLSKDHMENFITSTWVLSENWINYIDSVQENVDQHTLQSGLFVLMSMIRPYMTQPPIQHEKEFS